MIELDEKYALLKGRRAIVDLGVAPGGWAQVVRKMVPDARIVGIDLLPTDPIAGAEFLTMDFMDDAAPDAIMELLGGAPDLVLSDMAANTVGHPQTDHLRTIALAEAAADFAIMMLQPGGAFVAKVFQGGTSGDLLTLLKKNFTSVRHAKPPSSRKGSPELFVVALGKKA